MYDPELPAGYQDADLEMASLVASANREARLARRGICCHSWSGPAAGGGNPRGKGIGMKYEIAELKLVRLRECQVDNPQLDTPGAAVAFWRENVPNAIWFDADAETMVVLMVNTRRRIIGFARVASGTLDTILVHPREVFKLALVQGAAAVILMHNHPSGDSTPSEQDIKVTRDLARAGQLLQVEVLDHIVIGEIGESNPCGYCSLRELGYFTF